MAKKKNVETSPTKPVLYIYLNGVLRNWVVSFISKVCLLIKVQGAHRGLGTSSSPKAPNSCIHSFRYIFGAPTRSQALADHGVIAFWSWRACTECLLFPTYVSREEDRPELFLSATEGHSEAVALWEPGRRLSTVMESAVTLILDVSDLRAEK